MQLTPQQIDALPPQQKQQVLALQQQMVRCLFWFPHRQTLADHSVRKAAPGSLLVCSTSFCKYRTVVHMNDSIAERLVALAAEQADSGHAALLRQHLSASAVLLSANGSTGIGTDTYAPLVDACNALLSSSKVRARKPATSSHIDV